MGVKEAHVAAFPGQEGDQQDLEREGGQVEEEDPHDEGTYIRAPAPQDRGQWCSVKKTANRQLAQVCLMQSVNWVQNELIM